MVNHTKTHRKYIHYHRANKEQTKKSILVKAGEEEENKIYLLGSFAFLRKGNNEQKSYECRRE